MNNSRITRWILAVQEYKFDIIHCKGKDNIVADILSRYPHDTKLDEVQDNTHEYLVNHFTVKMKLEVRKLIKNIGKHQIEDNKLKTIINKIKEGSLDQNLNKFYKYVNNKLYRRQRNEWKLYVPNNISGDIIAEIHQMFGHLGTKKCMKMLQEHFTFDRMLKKVKTYIQTCDVCQKCKDTNNKELFGGTRAVIPTARGDLVSADYYGPLPTGAGAVSYTHLDVYKRQI